MGEKVKLLFALLKEEQTAQSLAASLKCPIKTVYKWLKFFEERGHISKKGFPAIYSITSQGQYFLGNQPQGKKLKFSRFSGRMKKSEKVENLCISKTEGKLPFDGLRLHAFKLKFSIIEREAQPSFWDSMSKMRGGWVKCFKRFEDYGVSVECSHKSLLMIFKAEWVPLSWDAFDKVRFKRWSVARELHRYLSLRRVVFDFDSGRVLSQHGAGSVQGEVKDSWPRGTEELFLDRRALGVFPPVFDGRAWVDASRGPEVESNDDLYLRKWLLVPESVSRIVREVPELRGVLESYQASIKLYDAQIKKHLAAVEGINRGLARMNVFFDWMKKREGKK